MPGNADTGELIRRVMLDESHEDFMPSDGKPPLTKNELQLIRWWIARGHAKAGIPVGASGDSAVLRPAVAQYLGFDMAQEKPAGGVSARINPDIPSTTDTALMNNLRKAGFSVRQMLHKPLMLDVTLPAGSGVKAAACRTAILPLAKNIIWLNLSGNSFTDNDLDFLSALANVEKLRLDGNSVTDNIIPQLLGLKHLEAINLNGTDITAVGVAGLKKNTAIRRVYTWQTTAGQ